MSDSDAMEEYCGCYETNETIVWKRLRKSPRVLKTRVKQFLYKVLHEFHMVGPAWKHISGFEKKTSRPCAICNPKVAWNIS